MKQAVTPLRLGSDRISSLLVRYAIPSIIAMTSSSLYNIVDSIFIGHGVGPIAISGVALSMPLMNIASAFGSLIGIGAAALTSIRLGQGRREAAEGVLGNVVLLGSSVGRPFCRRGGMSGGLRRIRNLLPAEMGRIPSSLPEVSQILFRIGRPEIEPPADEIRSVGALFRMLLLFL